MSTHYRQLTLAQRYQIWSLRDTGHKLRAIGDKVGVDFSTVSRELRRNRSMNGYKPQLAHKKSIDRKTTAKKSNKYTDKLKSAIEKGLCLGWSPDAISQRMKLEKIPESERLSHTSIYLIVTLKKINNKAANYIANCLVLEKHAGEVGSVTAVRGAS